jgi:HD superfamily phosphodiesterase
LLHDIGKPFAKKKNKKGYSSYYMHDKIGAELAKGIAFRLKWSKSRTDNVFQLIGSHMDDDSPLREADNSAKL